MEQKQKRRFMPPPSSVYTAQHFGTFYCDRTIRTLQMLRAQNETGSRQVSGSREGIYIYMIVKQTNKREGQKKEQQRGGLCPLPARTSSSSSSRHRLILLAGHFFMTTPPRTLMCVHCCTTNAATSATRNRPARSQVSGLRSQISPRPALTSDRPPARGSSVP